MQSIRKNDIATLKRRRDFLLKRIGMSDKDLSFDKSEAAAIDRIVKFLEEYEVNRFKNNGKEH